MWRTITAAAVLIILSACGTPEESQAITAEIHCEDWIARDLGLPDDDVQFNHRPTNTDTAPHFTVLGDLQAGGKVLAYQCNTTFDGNETWTLDKLDIIDAAAELTPPTG